MRALLRARRGELHRLTRLSVVVPTLDAAGTLGPCLERVAAAGERIVVDGGSVDATVRIAQQAGARIIVSPKGRGAQLRAGAEAAVGDWLLFLHADTLLGHGWDEAVAAHLAASEDAASFRLRLDSHAWQARLVEKAVAARVALLGLPYGDQGLLVPRRLYQEAGGYRPLPLMEDVDLVRRIGRRRLVALPADALTSARRWEEDGWLSRSLRNLWLLARWSLGASPERLARLYS